MARLSDKVFHEFVTLRCSTCSVGSPRFCDIVNRELLKGFHRACYSCGFPGASRPWTAFAVESDSTPNSATSLQWNRPSSPLKLNGQSDLGHLQPMFLISPQKPFRELAGGYVAGQLERSLPNHCNADNGHKTVGRKATGRSLISGFFKFQVLSVFINQTIPRDLCHWHRSESVPLNSNQFEPFAQYIQSSCASGIRFSSSLAARHAGIRLSISSRKRSL